MPDLKRNLQVKQPYVTDMPEGNGWPEPLTDESSPLRMTVNNGKNGESSMNDGISTSQQREAGHHAPEGDATSPATQPPYLDSQRASDGGFSTTAFVSDPGGSDYSVGDPANNLTDGDMGSGLKDPFKTTQQLRGEHHNPEGE
jgi:hypothetical protein